MGFRYRLAPAERTVRPRLGVPYQGVGTGVGPQPRGRGAHEGAGAGGEPCEFG